MNEKPAKPETTTIVPTKNGPYLVTNCTSLTRWGDDTVLISSTSTLPPRAANPRVHWGQGDGSRRAWSAQMAATVTTSSGLQPRDRSWIGLARPCRIGPIASALASRSVIL